MPQSPSPHDPHPPILKTKRVDQLKMLNILVVVSSDKTAGLLQKLFQELGFENILFAQDPAAGVLMLREHYAHIIVTDAELKIPRSNQLPRTLTADSPEIAISGLHFVQRLRNSPHSPAQFIPVLMLMGPAKPYELLHARDIGVNEIVTKPIEARNFCDSMVQIVDRPRNFVTAPAYRGPCRRRRNGAPPLGKTERRTHDIRLIRCNQPMTATYARIKG